MPSRVYQRTKITVYGAWISGEGKGCRFGVRGREAEKEALGLNEARSEKCQCGGFGSSTRLCPLWGGSSFFKSSFSVTSLLQEVLGGLCGFWLSQFLNGCSLVSFVSVLNLYFPVSERDRITFHWSL